MKRHDALLIGVLFLLCGCSLESSGVATLGHDHLSVTHRGRGLGIWTKDLRASALDEATRYCGSETKGMQVLNVTERPRDGFGDSAEVEVIFVCK